MRLKQQKNTLSSWPIFPFLSCRQNADAIVLSEVTLRSRVALMLCTYVTGWIQIKVLTTLSSGQHMNI